VTQGFDRVRPRPARVTTEVSAVAHDAEGKRALFSSAGSNDRPGAGSALVECSRCHERSVLGPMQALRAVWPSLHLALRVGRGEDVNVLGITSRDYPSFLRCPACGRPSWVRFTVQL
jgi:hypothetical protein